MTPRTPDPRGVVARSGRSLSGLPQFIRFVSTYPDGADLLRNLKAGILGQRGMSAAFLWTLTNDDHLVSLGSVGWNRDMTERYAVLPMELDAPAVRSARTGVPQISAAQAFGRTYLAAVDNSFLTTQFARVGAVSTIDTPISYAEQVVGVLGFATSTPWVDDDDSRALLKSIGLLLGLWMTHPTRGARATSPSLGRREWSLAFTPRQRQILRMAGEGMSNSDIARELLVSTSSVKQDLQQAMRALRSHDRATAFQRAVQLGLLD